MATRNIALTEVQIETIREALQIHHEQIVDMRHACSDEPDYDLEGANQLEALILGVIEALNA